MGLIQVLSLHERDVGKDLMHVLSRRYESLSFHFGREIGRDVGRDVGRDI